MSCACAERAGSCGKMTGFSTILRGEGGGRVSGVLTWFWGGKVKGKRVRGVNRLLVYLDGVLVPEGRIARQELVYKNPQRPPVHGRGVTLVVYDLGREVFGGAAQGVRLVGALAAAVHAASTAATASAAEALGEAKVDELDVALLVEQEVLGLEVAVGNAVLKLVQVLEHEDDLGGVEAGHGLVEAAVLAQVAEELAAGHVVEQQVEEVAVGEGGEQVGDEGVAGHVG